MKVVSVSFRHGVVPATPEKASHPTRGEYWRFTHGEAGRGRRLVFFPLGSRDFPGSAPAPGPGQEYLLIPVGSGHHILGAGRNDGEYLVFWNLNPGFRGGAGYTIEGSGSCIAKGYEAQGIAGRVGGAPCPVVHVTGPCVLRWTRTGRLYGSAAKWRAVYDGEAWAVMPDDAASDAVEAAFDY